MNYRKLASKLRAKTGIFSGYVSENLDTTTKRFVNEAVYGIMYSQSVMLTETGRSIETTVPLKKIEERFCSAKPIEYEYYSFFYSCIRGFLLFVHSWLFITRAFVAFYYSN